MGSFYDNSSPRGEDFYRAHPKRRMPRWDDRRSDEFEDREQIIRPREAWVATARQWVTLAFGW
jgi:hypothetical protein